MTGYIVPIDWFPDPTYVNTPDPEYSAYRMGINEKMQKSLWVFEQIVEVPTIPVEDMLPDPGEYEEIIVDGDTSKFGFPRQFMPFDTIEKVFDQIEADTSALASDEA